MAVIGIRYLCIPKFLMAIWWQFNIEKAIGASAAILESAARVAFFVSSNTPKKKACGIRTAMSDRKIVTESRMV